MIEVFRALDPTNDNRLILHRATNLAGEHIYQFTITNGDNTSRATVSVTSPPKAT